MKTKIVIDLLRYWGNHCDAHISNGEYQVEGSVLLKSAALKMERLCDDVSERNEKIGKLKKNNRKLRKELAERKAAPGWISVEERMPEVGEDVLIKYENNLVSGFLQLGNEWCCYTGNGWVTAADTDSNPTHWMPIPEPPESPKKVKTYKDVYRERIKEAFPDFAIKDPKPSYCRSTMFGEDFNQDYICGKMKDCEECWNQPYPEEEGGEE